MAASGRDQPTVSVVSGQELGRALLEGARPPLQVLHPGQLSHTERDGDHPPPDGEAVSDDGICINSHYYCLSSRLSWPFLPTLQLSCDTVDRVHGLVCIPGPTDALPLGVLHLGTSH